jgi:hypothetical protein
LAGMLMDGWTPEQLRHVIAGRPLPDPIRTSVGAVVSGRIRDALSGPAPSAVQGTAGGYKAEHKTPTPAQWTGDLLLLRNRRGECEGDGGLCGRPTDPGEKLCRRCVRTDTHV